MPFIEQDMTAYAPDGPKNTGLPGAFEGENNNVLMARISAVLRSNRGRRLMYIGWNGDQHPMVTIDQNQLSPAARDNVNQYLGLQREPRDTQYSVISPVDYVGYQVVTDLKEGEDLVNYVIHDENGERNIAVGELNILDAIIDAGKYWEDTSLSMNVGPVEKAKTMYTVLVPQFGKYSDTGVAILFKSYTNAEGSNEDRFRGFAYDTIRGLIINDEMQVASGKRGQRKGYIEAAAKVAGVSESGGFVSYVVSLFNKEKIDLTVKKYRDLFANILEVGRASGYLNLTEDDIKEMRNPLPIYDLNNLETDKLIELASAMREAARAALNR